MKELTNSEFINMKKDGVFVFHSFRCWTCKDHIKELQDKISYFYTIDYDADVDLYETYGIKMTPTTVVYKNDVKVYQQVGMLFETQINQLLEHL